MENRLLIMETLTTATGIFSADPIKNSNNYDVAYLYGRTKEDETVITNVQTFAESLWKVPATLR